MNFNNIRKKCIGCKEFKSLDEFNKNKNKKDGLKIYCKSCCSKGRKEWFRTKNGLISRIYRDQNINSKRRSHPLPSYTKQQLKEWAFNQNLFHKLFENWIKSGYIKNLVPSVDRKKDNLPYFLDNIQFMTWEENNEKGYADTRSGKLIHGHNPQKPVLQYDKQGNFIIEFVSVQQAGRKTNICATNISKVCNGDRQFAGGFKWEHKINLK